jgi:hypothetical protein
MILRKSFDFLRIFVESSSDITLVVRMPNGDYRCNDDTYGTNPALDGWWPSGRYQIWIGSYKEGEMPSYILKLTEHKNITPNGSGSNGSSKQSPNFGTIRLSRNFTPDPKIYRGTSGGSIRASGLSSNCSGWISRAPDHVMILLNSFDFLRIFAESSSDITLVVRMPNGDYRCNDDTYGTNPALDGRWSSGRYQIWIGSYKEGEMPSYILKLTEHKNITPHRSDSSSPSDLKSNFGTIQLSPHFSPDPKVYQGRSGGSIRASGISSNCSGWITSTPDHILILRNSFDFLRILAESLTDITLVVRMPNGEYRCNDDTYGTNPALDGRWPSGTYRIWIGSYKEDEIASYTLKFTEYKSTRP